MSPNQEPSVQDGREMAGDDALRAEIVQVLGYARHCLDGVVSMDDEDEGKDGGSASCQATVKLIDRLLKKISALGDAVVSRTDHSGGIVSTSPDGREAEESPSPPPPATSSALRDALEEYEGYDRHGGVDDTLMAALQAGTGVAVKAPPGMVLVPLYSAASLSQLQQRIAELERERDADIAALHATLAKPMDILRDRAEAAEAALKASDAKLAEAVTLLEPLAKLCDELDALRHEDGSTCVWRLKAIDIRRARSFTSSIQEKGK